MPQPDSRTLGALHALVQAEAETFINLLVARGLAEDAAEDEVDVVSEWLRTTAAETEVTITRSAKDGRFVASAEAEANPDATITQTVRRAS